MFAATEIAPPRKASLPLSPAQIPPSADAPPSDPLVGSRIGDRFRLTAPIARGGMGKVYRAEQAPLGRVCALKILDSSRLGDRVPGLDRRFWLEASVTSKLSHPNIVTIFDCGRTGDGLLYIAMEYLAGCTLARAIRAAGSFSEHRTVHVARQICAALREAHGAGVVHRDLKPTNVFLVERGERTDFVKVLDFGLVTSIVADGGEELTEKNLLLGSPRYMAPEQIRGEKVDARADVYALGIVMYEMLTGRVPFDGPGHVPILTAHLNEPPPPMRAPAGGICPSPALEKVVRRCIEKEREQRFGSMVELLDALDRASEPVGEYAAALWTGGAADSPDEAPHDNQAGEQHEPPQRPAADPRDTLRRPALVGALAVFAITALVASGAHRSDGQGSDVRASLHDPLDSAPAAAALPLAPAGPAEEALTPSGAIEITTDPTDCRVKEGSMELCRTTPCAILYDDPGEAEAGHVLTIVRDGYISETRRVSGAEGPLRVALTPRTAVAAPPHAAPRPPKDREPIHLAGYRLDVPY
jgi:eukaryotic-like serine/threonine-protein kinase